MIKQNITKLLDTEMERKDFLKLIGLGAVAALGITTILKAVTPTESKPVPTKADASYGSFAYGGVKNTRS